MTKLPPQRLLLRSAKYLPGSTISPISHHVPRGMIIENQVVRIKNLNPGGSYQQYNNLRTGELVGLREGNYTLLQGKNGELIEHTINDSLRAEPFSSYRVVTGKDGKLISLSEKRLGSEIQLTQGANGEIITGKIPVVKTDAEVANEFRMYKANPW